MTCRCPHCGATYEIKDNGSTNARRFQCKRCKQILVVSSGASRTQETAQERIHCLISNRAPFLLDKERPSYLGRARECQFWIDDPRASRQHAEIEWRGDGFVIRDLDSANGVFVDNEPITEQALTDRCKVCIAGMIMTYRIVSDLSELRKSVRKQRNSRWNDDTSVLPNADVGISEDFNGSLESLSVPEIAQLVRMGCMNGCLSILTHEKKKALLYFQRGNLKQADYDGKQGEEAAFAIFRLQQGLFGFKRGIEPDAPNITRSTDQILLEAARLMDESAGAEA